LTEPTDCQALAWWLTEQDPETRTRLLMLSDRMRETFNRGQTNGRLRMSENMALEILYHLGCLCNQGVEKPGLRLEASA
jgi:hypothetical protein